MRGKSYKKLAVVIAILVLTLSIASTGFAADTMANLKAYYRNIKIFRNGTQVQMTTEPFIVAGTTYIPLRAISEMLDKEVTWDGTSYTIGINDKPGSSVANLTQQLYTSQITISQLQNQIKDLEAKLSKDTSYGLDDLEDLLNDDYGKYKDVKFDIKLKESKSKIEVKIYVDLNKYDDEWYDLSEKQIKTYIEDIVYDVENEFKDATVSGFIEDSSKGGKELVSFAVSSKGKLSINLDGGSSSGSSDLYDLEDDLNYDWDVYKGIDFSITLSGNEDKITVKIDADVRDILDEIGESKIETYLYNIYDDITAVFKNATVTGYIRDDAGDIDFKFDSKGYVDLRW